MNRRAEESKLDREKFLPIALRAAGVFQNVASRNIAASDGLAEISADLVYLLPSEQEGSDTRVYSLRVLMRRLVSILRSIPSGTMLTESLGAVDFDLMLSEAIGLIQSFDGESGVDDREVFSIDEDDLDLPALPPEWPLPAPVAQDFIAVEVSSANVRHFRRFSEDCRRQVNYARKRLGYLVESAAPYHLITEIQGAFMALYEPLVKIGDMEVVMTMQWAMDVLVEANRRTFFNRQNVATALTTILGFLESWGNGLDESIARVEQIMISEAPTGSPFWLRTFGKEFGLESGEVSAAADDTNKDGMLAIGTTPVPKGVYAVVVPELVGLAEELKASIPMLRKLECPIEEWMALPHAIGSIAANLRLRRLMDAAEALEFWASIESMATNDFPAPPPPAIEELVAYVIDAIGRIERKEEPADPQPIIDSLGMLEGGVSSALRSRTAMHEDEISDLLLQIDSVMRANAIGALTNLLRSLSRALTIAAMADFRYPLSDVEKQIRSRERLLPEHYAEIRALLAGIGQVLIRRRLERGDYRGGIRQVATSKISEVVSEASRAMEKVSKAHEGLLALHRDLLDAIGQSGDESLRGIADRVAQIISDAGDGHGCVKVLYKGTARLQEVPFAQIKDRLVRVVDMACRSHGRLAFLDVGHTVSINGDLLEVVVPLVERVIDYLVNHSIEPVMVRAAAGKPHVGKVFVEVKRVGQYARFEVSTDGQTLPGVVFDASPEIAKLREMIPAIQGKIDLSHVRGGGDKVTLVIQAE